MMDPLQAREAFDRIADGYVTLLEARKVADKAATSYVRRMHEATAYEVAGLREIDAALRRQRVTLRQFIDAALHFPPIDRSDVVALTDMLARSMDLLGQSDEGVARLAKAVADALSPNLKRA